MWADVQDIVESLLQGSAGIDTPDTVAHDDNTHFLGAVVFKSSGITPDLATMYRVIDGQQRLTTLQILMAAAATALDAVGLETPAKNLRHLTGNLSEHEPLKIQYQRHQRGHDYERFPDVIRAATEPESELKIDGPIAECYRYFSKAIKGWLGDQGEQLSVAGTKLVDAIANRLRVVAIYLDAHEKEHAIFESLNARGEPLTEWDKIKNYLLYKADGESSLSADNFFEQYLDGFDDPWWRQLIGRGVQRPRGDVFIDYWLESQMGAPVSVRRVFREFQKYIDDAIGHLDETMKQLVKDAQYYKTAVTLGSELRTRESLFHSRRISIGAGAFWPLLLKIKNLNMKTQEEDACFELLESYLVRRLISRYQARSYDQVSLDIIAVLSNDAIAEDGAFEAIRKHLLAYSENTNLWPADSETKRSVLEKNLPSYAQKLVLSAIERSLIPSIASKPEPPPGLHVEHLMPRGWQEETWPLPDSISREQADEERQQAILKLGNLTLLNGGLNASISNGPWNVKRSAIQKSDNLFMNRKLLEESGDEWTEVDIEQRGHWMAEVVIKIWPHG